MPHQAVTLLAGVKGHLETCRSLLADEALSSKDVLEFAPLAKSFSTDKNVPAGAPPEAIEQLAHSQSALSDCIRDLEARAHIRPAAR